MAEGRVAVKVFTTPDCGFCRVVKAYLEAVGVAFEEVDVSADREAAEWLVKSAGSTGVPLTLFGESEFVLGWQKSRLDDCLRKFKLIK